MFLNGASPVGERIVLQGTPGAPAPTTVEIVGEAPSMRQRVRPDAEPVVYLRLDASAPSTVSLIARGSGDPAALAAGIRQDLLALDPAIPLYRVSTMAQTLRDVNWNGRVSAALMRFLALLALGLSMTGMYAVTAYAASRRAGEIAVRMALGARPRHVGWLLLRRAALQAALGFAVGVACTFLWGHVFASGQAGTGVTDLQPLVIAGALIASVTALTAIGPIRRAVLSDPVSVLRSE
jgi:ABC-type antimicrobial peptide transport system permease subunit